MEITVKYYVSPIDSICNILPCSIKVVYLTRDNVELTNSSGCLGTKSYVRKMGSLLKSRENVGVGSI